MHISQNYFFIKYKTECKKLDILIMTKEIFQKIITRKVLQITDRFQASAGI